MDYKSRLTNLKLLPLMYIYELTDILFAIKSFKNALRVLIYPSICNLMNRQLDLPTLALSQDIQQCHHFCRLPRLRNALYQL